MFIIHSYILFIPLDGSKFVHPYYVYPKSTDESEAELYQFKQGLQMDPSLERIGFEKHPNEFLWQKRTFTLGKLNVEIEFFCNPIIKLYY